LGKEIREREVGVGKALFSKCDVASKAKNSNENHICK